MVDSVYLKYTVKVAEFTENMWLNQVCKRVFSWRGKRVFVCGVSSRDPVPRPECESLQLHCVARLPEGGAAGEVSLDALCGRGLD